MGVSLHSGRQARRRPAQPRAQAYADARDQRDAVRGCDAGAADRLHGHRAPAAVGAAGRPAQRQGPVAEREPGAADRDARPRGAGLPGLRPRSRSGSTSSPAKLKAIAKNAEEQTILFRGDRQVPYGRVSEVLNAVIQGGYKKFTFVSGPEEIRERGPEDQAVAPGTSRAESLQFGLVISVLLHAAILGGTLISLQSRRSCACPSRSRWPSG